MRLPTPDLSNRVRWLVNLRWIACAGVAATVWLASAVLGVLPRPGRLYAVAGAMVAYNALFGLLERRRGPGQVSDLGLVLQIALDQIALLLLLYFSGISHNPFIFFFVFHMIIAALLLRGRIPYFLAGLGSFLVGAGLLLEYLQWIPAFQMNLPHLAHGTAGVSHARDGVYLLGLFLAVSSTLWITVYLTSSVQSFVQRAQEEIRQKEKMLGIGELVAGIAHQVSNPLDGLQNCLRLIGERVKDDERLNTYIPLMTEALDRIERTARRVQAFARPHGLDLRATDVNEAVRATRHLLGEGEGHGVAIVAEEGLVPRVMGDPQSLQAVGTCVFNLANSSSFGSASNSVSGRSMMLPISHSL